MLSTAFVAEFISTSACHVVTSFVLLYPKLATRTLFSSDRLCPIDKLIIFVQVSLVDAFSFSCPYSLVFGNFGLSELFKFSFSGGFLSLNFSLPRCFSLSFLCGLELLTGLLNVVRYVAVQAVFLLTLDAEKVGLRIVFFVEEIVTAICRALNNVHISVSELFPFEALGSVAFLWGEEFVQVGERDVLLAFGIRTLDWELAIVDAGLDPGSDALFVINTRTGSHYENV